MFKSIEKIFHHVVIFTLSASAALSLPYIGRFIAHNYVMYWSLIEGNKVFLISMEIGLAVLLITLFNYLGRSTRDRRLSRMAAKAGLVHVTNAWNMIAGEKVREFDRQKVVRLKEKQGLSKDVMLISATGSSTFVDPRGDLHNVIQNCREAKIMLLDPFGEGANIRARGIPIDGVTHESFKNQIMKSIEFLRGLNEVRQNIRLKLYPDAPLLKLAVLGDYIGLKFYYAGLSTREMSEYIFRHTQDNSGLYTLFHQFFLSRWRDPAIPEYDFCTAELIYRDSSYNEVRREKMPSFAA